MFFRKSFGVVLALGLCAVDVNAHGRTTSRFREIQRLTLSFADGIKRQHHHHHDLKRQDTESVCSTCTTTTVSSWIPYDQAVFQTSTVTAWTTQLVMVDSSPATTITTTLSDMPSTTGTSQKAKRGLGPGYAMTYTPYDQSTGACMSADTVRAQLQQIQGLGFNCIRLYGVDCDQLTTTADTATQMGFTVTLGIYIDDTGTTRGYSDLATVISWAHWSDNIAYINIGKIFPFIRGS
jgi:hypothetical protein